MAARSCWLKHACAVVASYACSVFDSVDMDVAIEPSVTWYVASACCTSSRRPCD